MSLQTNIVTSVVRSVEPDRVQPVNARANELSQEQLAALAKVEVQKKKVQSSEKAAQSKIKEDKEPGQNAQEEHQGYQNPSYGSNGQTEAVGEESEGHIFDALA